MLAGVVSGAVVVKAGRTWLRKLYTSKSMSYVWPVGV